MSKSPQLPVILGISLALILVLIGLRHQAAGTRVSSEETAVVDDDELNDGRADLTTNEYRVSRLRNSPDSSPVTNYKPSPLFVSQRTEDFEAQKLRAFGNSYIYGIVRGDDNKPLEAAKLQLFENDPNTTNPPLRESLSDKEGSFTLAQLHDGDRRFVLVARAAGHAPEAHFVYMQGRPTEQDIRLRPGVPVTGTVRDASTSQPLSGVSIVHPNFGEQVFAVLGSVTSGSDGRFHFPDVHPGGVTTLAQHDGYRHTIARLKAPNENAEILMMAGGATIRGKTVDRLTSKPQGGAKVWLEGQGIADAKLSAADGTFEFTEVPGGTYQLYAVRGMRSERQTVEVGNTETKEGLTIVLPSDLFVSGKIINANKSRPLPGVKIWYRAPSGRNSVISDEEGRFAFETLAVNNYTIEIHEKGFLPAADRKTTSTDETITRPVPKNASSDSIVIRMRPVPVIEGMIKGTRGREGPEVPMFGADVAVDYLLEKEHKRVMTKTDINGNFFVNLPDRRRGDAKILAFRNFSIDAANVRIPQRRPEQMVLKRSVMFAQVLLVDQAPLEGIKVEFSHFLPDNRPEDQAILIKERDFYSNRGGRLVVPLPEDTKVQLTFNTPDGSKIPKVFNTNQLLNSQPIFIYDPVSKDILSDVKPRNRPAGNAQPPGSPPGQPGKPNQNRNNNQGAGKRNDQGQKKTPN